MKTAHLLIDAVLDRYINPLGLTKTAELPDFLNNQTVQYGLGGAAAGGIGSALRSILGNPDPDLEGGASSRFLKALAMGGLAGAGVGGGAQLMGIDLPTAKDLQVGGGSNAPSWQTSAGLGILGAGGAAGLAGLSRGRLRNLALGSRLGKLKGTVDKGGVGRTMYSKLLKDAPTAPSLLDRILGRSPEVSAIRRNMARMEGEGLAGSAQEGLSDAQKALKDLSKPVDQNYWLENLRRPAIAGGAATGILHQLLGSE